MPAVLFVVGAVLLTVGVGFVYWPAALIVAGLLMLGAAALTDLAQGARDARPHGDL